MELYTIGMGVCVCVTAGYCPKRVGSIKTSQVNDECRHKQSYLGAMFCTMALLIFSSLQGPLLLLQKLVMKMAFPENLFSIAAFV